MRVYPDDLMADTHEPPLTEEERAAGEKFWRDGWAPENEREAWRALVSHVSGSACSVDCARR